MFKTSVADVKARLSEYLDRAESGERIVICRHNRPVAELRAVEKARTEPRPLGPLPGRPAFDVPAGFFEPLSDDELEQWDGTVPATPAANRAPRARSGASRVAESRQKYGRPVRPRGPRARS